MLSHYSQLIDCFARSGKIVAFTGAGISTESGISDYRSKGGLWQRFQPVTLQQFLASEDERKKYWHMKTELYRSFLTARPNAGHRALAKLEEMGKLKGLITQNIDGLHALAGNTPEKILELHGTNRNTICLSCGTVSSWESTFERLQKGEEAPLCRKCGGYLKPNTISFGQSLDPRVLEASVTWAQACDLFLVVGSTLVVEPAASLPRLAKANGAKLVIINLSETSLDHMADLVITMEAGTVLSEVISQLEHPSNKQI